MREGFGMTVKAFAARNVMEDHYPVPHTELPYGFSDGRHDASSLVSEDTWSGVRSSRNFLEIGTTDSAGVDSY